MPRPQPPRARTRARTRAHTRARVARWAGSATSTSAPEAQRQCLSRRLTIARCLYPPERRRPSDWLQPQAGPASLTWRGVRTAHKLSPGGPELSSAGRNNILLKGSGATEDNFPGLPKITPQRRVGPCGRLGHTPPVWPGEDSLPLPHRLTVPVHGLSAGHHHARRIQPRNHL